ncbi:MAG TPA: thiamine pyrophosphate-dependent enzyme [Pirellulales bacterium]|nr:thiamine pyrophosphate-dependent enzyme [Pirellulales bacterium]
MNSLPVADAPRRMPLVPALETLRAWRTDQIVVTAMNAAREWLKFPEHPLDLIYLPSAMGQPTSLGLGLALAQPAREVIVTIGDGSLLLNLGALVTIAAVRPLNLTLLMLDNGVYEVTGSQTTAAAQIGADFCGLARAAGFTSVAHFAELSAWQAGLAAAMKLPGPRFLRLVLEPITEHPHLPVPPPIVPRLARFQRALGVAVE